MKKFYVIVLVLLSCSPTEILSARKTKKKTYKTTTEVTETTTSQPAIIAIEIVDPNENSTSSKQSKRTIESALGYGYNNFKESKPRYEVYKYSQHDIPAYTGSTNQALQSTSNSHINVQKSVQYSLPTTSHQVADSSNILQPGTTLYSSLSEKGHVGGLSSSLPETSNLVHSASPVPVVVLRIYPSQLKDSTIQANLPKSHPYAKSINSLNIQQLLLQYIKTLKNPGILSQYSVNQGAFGQNYRSNSHYSSQGGFGQNHGASSQYYSNQGLLGQNHVSSSQYSGSKASLGHNYGSSNQHATNPVSFGQGHSSSGQYYKTPSSLGHNTYSSNQIYSAPSSSSEKSTQTNYQTSNYYTQNGNQNVPKYQSTSGGAQNYLYYQQSFPQQSAQDYTNQNQYNQQQYSNYDGGVTIQEAPAKYEINDYQSGDQFQYQSGPASQKSKTLKTSAPTSQPQYYYVQPSTQSVQSSYSTESSNYYLPPQALQYTKESVQASPAPEQQYYTANADPQYSEYYQGADQNKLLTFENYPTSQHTRVVFRTKTGDVRTAEQEQTSVKEIKTIKIQVPDNVAKVEVQETERPYYGSQSAYPEASKQVTKEPSADTYQQDDESDDDISQNHYYLPPPQDFQQNYNNENRGSEVNYDYQNVNVNYDDMAKYFNKRGAMPKYFFKSPEDVEDEESDDNKEESTEASEDTEDIISSYEKAAFPSTTASVDKKTVKSKKISQV